MAIALNDYLFTPVAGVMTPWVNVWVRLVSNITSTAYVSDAATDSKGRFSFAIKPPGDTYTVYTGPTNVGAWTSTGDVAYSIPVVAGEGLKFTIAPLGGSSDDGPNIQTIVNAAPVNSIIEFQPGTYLVNTTVTPKSNQTFYAPRGSVTLKRTVAGDVFVKGAALGALDQVAWIGLGFDLTGQTGSALNLIGDDAHGQLTNITVRDCSFKNPGPTWMMQFAYVYADPAIPTSKNRNIRIEDCLDDATGQTFTLENIILENCQDVVLSNNRFLNSTATMAAHVAVYGFCRNVRFIGNYIEQFASSYGVYVIQSDAVSFVADQFRTTLNQTCIQSFSSKDVKVSGCQLVTGNGGVGVGINDFAGTTFDGHTNLYNFSSGISVQDNRMDVMSACVFLNLVNTQGQTDILIKDNLVSPLRNLFLIQNMPNAPSATVQRIKISGNHVASHSGFSGGSACIELAGNASATLGGLSGVQVSDNYFAASAAGGTGTDIEILNLADDITIQGNRHAGSATPIVPAATTTKLRIFDNPGYNQGLGGVGIMQAPAQTVGATAAIASFATLTTPNDGPAHCYRVSAGVTITTLGSGSFNVQVTYTDAGGNARTCNIPLCATAGGVYAALANTADDWKGSVVIYVAANSTITIKTAGTFTGCTYNANGLIEMLR